jgi:hypothetical protein
MRTRTALLASLIALSPLAAMAQNSGSYPENAPLAVSDDGGLFAFKADQFTAGVKIGTLGIGGEVGYRPLDMFGVRVDGEAFSFSDNITAGHVNYHATAELQSYGALADLYPFGAAFRVTGGLRLNENEARGQSTSVQATINGQRVTVPTSDFGDLGAKVTFDKLSPYVGFGWGAEIIPNLELTTDFGVMFNGNPKASVNGGLNANGVAAVNALGGGSAAAQLTAAGIASARSSLQGYVDGYEYYPVIEIGLAYKF